MSTVTYPITIVGKCYRTVIPIIIINPHTKQALKTAALLDTGADACAFPENIAKNTGHNLKGAGVINNVTTGIGGVGVNTWKHTFSIGILDAKAQNVLNITRPMLVDCFEHNNAPPLLGSSDFLCDYKVTIDYPNKTITLEW